MSNQIAEVIEKAKERFMEIAPKNFNYEAEKGFAIQHLKNNSYLMKVAQENPIYLAQAITNIAAVGLSLNPVEKQAYLIPRSVRNGNRYESRVYLEPSYMGLCKLATDSGSITWVQARCVYDLDKFEDNGIGEKPTHSYEAFKHRGPVVGAYCVAKTKDGDYLTTIMDLEKIHNIRGRSESWKKKANSGVWQTDFEEQAKKTVIRNASKTWPKTNIHFQNAVHFSNENVGFDPIVTEPNVGEFTGNEKEYYDQLIEKGNALDMFLFLNDIDYTIKTSLYHSFVKGTKGKYQAISDDLERKGLAMFNECLEAIQGGLNDSDDSAVMEIVEGSSDSFIKLIRERLESNQVQLFDCVINA